MYNNLLVGSKVSNMTTGLIRPMNPSTNSKRGDERILVIVNGSIIQTLTSVNQMHYLLSAIGHFIV
jgi:hypothetical protein